MLRLALLTWLDAPRCAVSRRRKPRVPTPAAPASGNKDAVAFGCQVSQQSVWLILFARFFVNKRANRNGQFQIRTVATRTVRAFAMLAALGCKFRMEAIIDEGVGVRAGDDIHGA